MPRPRQNSDSPEPRSPVDGDATAPPAVGRRGSRRRGRRRPLLKEINLLRPLFSRRDKFRYLGLFGLMLIGAGFETVGISLVPAFAAAVAVPDRVFGHSIAGPFLERFGIANPTQLVVFGSCVLLVVYLAKTAYAIFLTRCQIRMTEYHRVRLADRLFHAYMQAPWEFLLHRNSAELLRNAQMETTEIVQKMINPLLSAAKGLLLTLFTVGLVVALTPPIALIPIVTVGLGSVLFTGFFRKRLIRFGRQAKLERRRAIQAVNEGLGSLPESRILGRTAHFENGFHRSNSRFARYMSSFSLIRKMNTPILELIAVTGLLAILLTFALAGHDLVTFIPTMALLAAASVRLRASVGEIVSGLSQAQFSKASVQEVTRDLKALDALGVETTVASGRKRKRGTGVPSSRPGPLPFQDRIALDEIVYRYPTGDRPSLDGVSLVIRKGESIGFVGPTGSGKSTLIHVLLGLLRPQSGSVLCDGAPIHDSLAAWQANIGYVPQSIYLLDGTVRRNVAFGVPDDEIDEARVWEVLRVAQIDSFIRDLSHGLETVVGERGARISGGQRQRIGLARALYHRPAILVLDEATSALDDETERAFTEDLENLGDTGLTKIMIAHRLSSLRHTDRIILLDAGRIADESTFATWQERRFDLDTTSPVR